MFEITTKLISCRCFNVSPRSSSSILTLIHRRNFGNDHPSIDPSSGGVVDTKKSRVNELKKYWIFRYIDYVKNYDKILEKNFPRALRVYRVFSSGTREFYKDLKQYMKVRKKQRLYGPKSLTSAELQLAYTMPKDLIKISPILLVSAIPFTNYVIFPLAFYFPHLLLTSHYWSIQDKLNFLLKEHKRRLKHNKPLFRCVQAQMKSGMPDQDMKQHFREIIALLGSGRHPSTEEILSCIKLFSGPPYALKSLRRNHIRELLLIHGMSRFGFGNRYRLLQRGELIKRMDNAINREGGPTKLPYDAIRWALSFRGLNPVNMSEESMQMWLSQWLEVSFHVDKDSLSLLLHCPIFLAYNHESNWALLYRGKKM